MKSFWPCLFLATVFFTSLGVEAESHKKIVGATEVVFITEANQNIKARVDTGAKTSSIHAENIEISPFGDAKGKPISFFLVTDSGLSKKVVTRVASVVKVRTSEGAEQRYVVPLQMTWQNTKKTVLVTLNDRSKMTYRLLLGRNWLRGDFIVDVEKNDED